MNETIDAFEVTDRQSFAAFLDALRQNLANEPYEWENISLPRFLEAMSAYTADIQGYYDNSGQDISADVPSWKVFADIMKGASIYE